jgi:hypothetical protein
MSHIRCGIPNVHDPSQCSIPVIDNNTARIREFDQRQDNRKESFLVHHHRGESLIASVAQLEAQRSREIYQYGNFREVPSCIKTLECQSCH